MAESFQLNKILLTEYRKNSITVYNRIEPNPRTANFDRSLKAEVRDALWMLTRQWQFGEFQGEDAASAVTAQISGQHTRMDRINFPGNIVLPYNESFPLETIIERESIGANLFIAVQMGRYFMKLMNDAGLSAGVYLQPLLKKYILQYSPDKNDYEGVHLLNAVRGKMFDGFLLHKDIIASDPAGNKFLKWINETFNTDPNLSASLESFKLISDSFRAWHRRNYGQPARRAGAWLPSQLEYQFNIASPVVQEQQKTLEANQYSEGHLDWYSFDVNLNRRTSMTPEPPAGNAVHENTVSFIPTTVTFKGMPNPRFWMMEESKTDFGKIDTSPTGLLHLLLAEFGLIYSNDWFMLPYPMTINTLCEIKKIVVTDVFGQDILVRPAGLTQESSWQRWAMFYHTNVGDRSADSNMFYLPPAIPKVLEGEPLEQVNFFRDEMANMVWAVENIVPSQANKGISGDELALKEQEPEPFSSESNAPVRYILGTTVPDNWIPFIPVHIEGSDSEIRLQRAKLPGAKGASGVLLKEKPAPYYINEEEILRSGIKVKRAFQRTRWLNGKTYLWIGRYKEAGRGEGLSDLKFDQIEDLPVNNA